MTRDAFKRAGKATRNSITERVRDLQQRRRDRIIIVADTDQLAAQLRDAPRPVQQQARRDALNAIHRALAQRDNMP